MSEVSPARALRDKAEAMLKPGQEFAVATDGQSQDGVVLVAIAKHDWCGVLTIDRAEYDVAGAVALGRLLGFPEGPWPQTAYERAKKAKKAA